MESCSDSDSNDDGHEIGRHGHGDEDIVINTEHASKEVDAEGDGEAEAVAGVDEGMNSCLGRILPRREGDESGDEEESNNNELTMPKRKLKDPAPVWKHCATRLPDGKEEGSSSHRQPDQRPDQRQEEEGVRKGRRKEKERSR